MSLSDSSGETMRDPESQPTLPSAEGQPNSRRYGKYITLEEIGRGGFGSVWLSLDTDLGRNVALKIFRGHNDEDIQRFRREATLAASLRHPNIATVFEIGEEKEESWLAMEYIEGNSLERAELDLIRKVEILRDVCLAVQYAHDQGVIHRDLKPANLMIDGGGRVHVLDFGLARRSDVDSSITRSGAVMGTPAYMSPEQADGEKVDGRTDIYSLGATLYRMVTGRVPFDGTPAMVISKVMTVDPETPRKHNAQVPIDIEVIILKAMAKEPDMRYGSAGEMAEDLSRFLRGEPIAAKVPSWTYRLKKRVRRNPWAWGLAASVLVVLLVAAGVVGAILSAGDMETEAKNLVIRAERMYEHNNYEETEKLARQAQNLVPNHPGARYWLARLKIREYQRLRGVPEARVVRGAVEIIPPPPESDLERELRKEIEAMLRDAGDQPIGVGIMALWTGDMSAALKAFALVKPDDPGGWEASFYAGVAHYLKGEFEEARKKLDRHRLRDPVVTLPVWIRTLIADGQRLESRGEDPADTYQQATTSCIDLKPLDERTARILDAQAMVAWGRADALRGTVPEKKFTEALQLVRGIDDAEAWSVVGDAHFARATYRRGVGKINRNDPREYIESERAYDRALKRDSMFWSALSRRAEVRYQEYLFLKDYRKERRELLELSKEDYLEALKHKPDYLDSAVGLAEVNRDLHLLDSQNAEGPEAFRREVKELTALIEKWPAYGPAYVARSRAWNNVGIRSSAFGKDPREYYRNALEDVRTAVDINPGNAFNYSWRATVRQNLANYSSSRGEDPLPDFEKAEADFKRAIEINPNFSTAYLNQGGMHMNRGTYLGGSGEDPIPEFRTAIEKMTRGIEINGLDWRGWHRRGMANNALGMRLRLFRKDPTLHYRDGLRDLTKALDLNPGFWEVLSDRGSLWNSIGMYRRQSGGDAMEAFGKAEEDFKAAMIDFEDSAEVLKGYGVLLFNMGDTVASKGQNPGDYFRRAIARLSESLDVNPEDADTLNSRANAYHFVASMLVGGGQDAEAAFKSAIDDYKQAVKLSPKNANNWRELGKTHHNYAFWLMSKGINPLSGYLNSIKDFSEAIRLNPRDWRGFELRAGACHNTGHVYEGLKEPEEARGQYKAAIRDYDHVIKRVPTLATAWLDRGDLKIHLGEFESAIKDLEKAKELDPKLAPRADQLMRRARGE